MTKNKSFLFAVGVLIGVRSVSALAGAPTQYEKTMAAYLSATTPAAISDFKRERPNRARSALKCFDFGKAEPDFAYDTEFGIIDQEIEVADDAPDFPAEPARYAEKVFHAYDINHFGYNVFELVTNESNSTDFVITLAKNNWGVYADFEAPVRISVRKSGDRLVFISTSADSSDVWAGYCERSD